MPLTAPVQAVIFDLAGTTIDCGCMSPVAVFIEVFRRNGVRIDAQTARGPMGTHKRDHIARLLAEPEVAAAWVAAHGVPASDVDIDRLYHEAEPLQIAVLPDHAEPIPGFVEVAAALWARGIRLGATTGYTRPMVEVLAPQIAARGWRPDVLVCASDVPAGRPAPHMNHAVAAALGVDDPRRCVVVGDTVVDMAAGRAAEMWTVGVALTGNEVGLGWAELLARSPDEVATLRARAGARLRDAGADAVIDSVVGLPALLDRLGDGGFSQLAPQ